MRIRASEGRDGKGKKWEGKRRRGVGSSSAPLLPSFQLLQVGDGLIHGQPYVARGKEIDTQCAERDIEMRRGEEMKSVKKTRKNEGHPSSLPYFLSVPNQSQRRAHSKTSLAASEVGVVVLGNICYAVNTC
ncbi:uncharacterized protein H6S33_011927 [Morchella sextelata]|uniref:uncharacterized protein n=1 Tax=Morchella sextelata TaxID=1174677 RepID=UPI001D05290F|nr:uncharacterized protein H6S33_011927 [Morchella sextelata]KAH0610400.1 hypothetical protein H6S33_011927 [Morchella sextelata]